MMQATLTVDAQVMGRKQPLIHDWKIDLSFAPESITLRDLITRIVLAQVQAFRERQADQQLVRILTAEQIELAASQGKIDLGGHELAQQVDSGTAVATALQAFEDGLYFVFVDGQQQLRLDEPVSVQDESRVRFVRLMMLAGG